MNKQASAMSDRIQGALRSGKLLADGNYTIPALIAILGTTRAELSAAVNRDFGSIVGFCEHAGLTGMKPASASR